MFKKTLKQIEATKVLSKYKYTALYGGSRSGKTFIIVYSLIVRASKCRSRHLIIRRTFASVKRAVFLDTFPKVVRLCFPSLKLTYNRTDFYVTFPNGSEIWFAGLDDSRVEKILGMEFSTIYFNEGSELSFDPIQIVLTRLAEKNSLIKRVWFDFNPPSKASWSFWLFMKKLSPSDNEPIDNPDEYGHLLMNPSDNLDNIDEEYIKFLSRLPKKERERFLEGKFADSDDGLAYYAFNRDIHVTDTAERQYGTVYSGMDFNVAPMTSCQVSVVGDELWVFDEAWLMDSDTYKMCDHLKRKGYQGTVIPDSTGKNRKTSGKSDFNILTENGFTIMSVRNPYQVDRVNNLNRLFTANKIKIHPRCKKLINDLSRVSWKDNKLDQVTDKTLTHISDCLGYVAWRLMPIGGEVVKISSYTR